MVGTIYNTDAWEMGNVLKQQVLDLEADRLRTHFRASNRLCPWLANWAYLLVERVLALGLHGTELALPTAGSIRLQCRRAPA